MNVWAWIGVLIAAVGGGALVFLAAAREWRRKPPSGFDARRRGTPPAE